MKLHYRTLGKGSHALLAFHGIGQTGQTCFNVFDSILGHHYTIYAFDLPFHGESAALGLDERWNDGTQPLGAQEWKDFLEQFLYENRIERFSVAGFSLGARFALASLTSFQNRIENAYLIAPDGINEQLIYRLATSSSVGRKIFRFVIEHPVQLQKAGIVLNRIGLLHKSVRKVLTHMTTGSRPRVVYLSWVNFRKLRYTRGGAASVFPHVFLFTGTFDRLITRKHVRSLARLLPPTHVVELPCGHTNSVEQAAIFIQKQLIARSE